MVRQRRFKLHKRAELSKLNGSLVAIEQIKSAEVLAKLALDTDLQEVVFEQNSVVFANES